MINFFSKYKIIFYFANLILVVLYLFPGSLLGCVFIKNCKIQPQITSDYFISSNHFYAFGLITIVSFFTYMNSKNLGKILIYLVFLSVILEISHLVVPNRSFQWSDFFGNFLGVVVVILIYTIIKKYGFFRK